MTATSIQTPTLHQVSICDSSAKILEALVRLEDRPHPHFILQALVIAYPKIAEECGLGHLIELTSTSVLHAEPVGVDP